DLPFLNWRYILFTWNDSDEEMNRAREIAAAIGIDRLCWEITDHPEHAYSRRFVPGSPALDAIRHEVWDNNNLGNAVPGAMPRARRAPAAGADPRPQSLAAAVSGTGQLRTASGAARRPIVRGRRRAHRSRLRARLAPAHAGAWRSRRRRHRHSDAEHAGPVRAQ